MKKVIKRITRTYII